MTTRYDTLTDIELARAIEGEDRDALRYLMRRHNQMLYRVARSILKDDAEAEDALQEAYVLAYHRIGGYRGDAKLSTWLARIVVNESLAMLRKGKRAAEFVTAERAPTCEAMPCAGSDGAPADDPEQTAMRGDLRRLLEKTIDELPPPLRIVFVLRAVQDMTVEETAEALDIPAATVRTRLFRARYRLRETLVGETDAGGASAFGFAGRRCDRIVTAVIARFARQRARQQPMLVASRGDG